MPHHPNSRHRASVKPEKRGKSNKELCSNGPGSDMLSVGEMHELIGFEQAWEFDEPGVDEE